MREAIGGGWLLTFVIVFVMLFSSYLAVSINYTKAFKVKNKIIDLIETNEGFTESKNRDLNSLSEEELEKDKSTEAKIFKVLKDIGYYTTLNVICDPQEDGEAQSGGYCVKRIPAGLGAYYKVKTFILFELDLFNFTIQIPIKGETKIIYYDNH